MPFWHVTIIQPDALPDAAIPDYQRNKIPALFRRRLRRFRDAFFLAFWSFLGSFNSGSTTQSLCFSSGQLWESKNGAQLGMKVRIREPKGHQRRESYASSSSIRAGVSGPGCTKTTLRVIRFAQLNTRSTFVQRNMSSVRSRSFLSMSKV